jgi:hypothetical protein
MVTLLVESSVVMVHVLITSYGFLHHTTWQQVININQSTACCNLWVVLLTKMQLLVSEGRCCSVY